MAFITSPWYTGQLSPIWAVTAEKDDSTPQVPDYQDFTGLVPANFNLRIQPVDSSGSATGPAVNGTGSFTITNASQGKFTYAPNAADLFVTTVGYCQLQFVVTYPTALPWKSDIYTLQTKAGL